MRYKVTGPTSNWNLNISSLKYLRLVGPRPAVNALPTRGPPTWWGGPRVQETLLGVETTPSKDGQELLGHREVGGVVVKPNTAGGSVGRARCRHRKVVETLYTTSWQSNIVHPPERPGTRADEGGGPSQGLGFLFT